MKVIYGPCPKSVLFDIVLEWIQENGLSNYRVFYRPATSEAIVALVSGDQDLKDILDVAMALIDNDWLEEAGKFLRDQGPNTGGLLPILYQRALSTYRDSEKG